jgi:tetratricopeptide (TPR) repeat protein
MSRLLIPSLLALTLGPLSGAVEARTIEALPEPTAQTPYLLPISAALDAGDFTRAESLVRERLAEEPQDAVAWEVLGVVLSVREDVQGADEAYAKAVEIDPRRLTAWVKRGDLAEAAGDPAQALVYWQGAAEVAPTYRPANERLGRAYADARDMDKATGYYEAAVAAETPDEVGAKADLALVYNQTGRAADTLTLLAPWDDAQAEATAPVLLALGNAYAQTGNAEAALARYERGLSVEPENTGIARAMGALLVAVGQPERAIGVLEAVAAAEPVDAFANLTYARALAIQGRHPEAITAAERALEVSGTTDIAQQALSVEARSQLFDQDPDAAIATAARLARLFPERVEAWRENAAIVAATGRYAAAKGLYDEALEQFADDAPLLRGRSLVNIRLEDLEAAAGDAAAAARVDPGWREARFLMGEIARARGKPREAEAAFHAALEIDPGHWPSVLNLARLAQATGDVDTARDLATRAVDLSGGDKAAQDLLDELGPGAAN